MAALKIEEESQALWSEEGVIIHNSTETPRLVLTLTLIPSARNTHRDLTPPIRAETGGVSKMGEGRERHTKRDGAR